MHLFTHLLLSLFHTSMSFCAVIHIFVCPYCISFCSGAVTPCTVIVSHLYMPLEASSLLRYPSFPLSSLLTLPGLLVFKLQLLLQSGLVLIITYPTMCRFSAVRRGQYCRLKLHWILKFLTYPPVLDGFLQYSYIFAYLVESECGPGSSVGEVTDYGLGGPG